jgi:hypothetical protein
MSITNLRVAGAVLFYLLILITGFWLGIAGKPFNVVILNAHKLISLAGVILLGITVYQINKVSGLGMAELVTVVATCVFCLTAIVSGGLSSIDTMPNIVVAIHRITLSLAALSAAVTLYLLLYVK